jgi:predicted nucleic acid-binding protein
MKKLKIYLDTSVIGGCFDEEFEIDSKKLIKEIISGEKLGVVSEVTLRELSKAPMQVRNYFISFKDILETVIITEEADILSEEYLKAGVVSRTFKDDTLHIAAAVINKVDILVSWNFKHIVNYNKITMFNSVNILNGYQQLQIFSPKEVLNYEN